MKRLLWMRPALLCATLAVACLPSHAQPVATLAPSATQVPQRILYQRNVPASVLKLMPRRAKSLFFGKFKLSPRGTEHALHLFDPRPERGVNAYNYSGHRAFMLDLFEHQKRWHRANRLSFIYRAPTWGLNRFDAEQLWLDPLKRQRPVLHLRCYSTNDFGPCGDDVLLIFTKGLVQSAIGQSSWFGDARASYFLGQHSRFVQVGEDGLMRVLINVEVAIASAVDESLPDPHIQQRALHWSGAEFVLEPFKPIDGEVQEPAIERFFARSEH